MTITLRTRPHRSFKYYNRIDVQGPNGRVVGDLFIFRRPAWSDGPVTYFFRPNEIGIAMELHEAFGRHKAQVLRDAVKIKGGE